MLSGVIVWLNCPRRSHHSGGPVAIGQYRSCLVERKSQSIMPLCRLPEEHVHQGFFFGTAIRTPQGLLYSLGTLFIRSTRLVRVLGVPRSGIAQFATALAPTLASPSKLLRQILCWNLLQQLCLIITSQNRNFANGDLVQKELDRSPHRRKEAWCIDNVEFTHAFGVSVLTNIGSP